MNRVHALAILFFCAAPLVSALWPLWPYLLLVMLFGVIIEGLEILVFALLGLGDA